MNSTSQSLLTNLKKKLQTAKEPWQWLNGLKVDLSGKTIVVKFQNHLFGRWFKLNKEDYFTAAIKKLRGDDVEITYNYFPAPVMSSAKEQEAIPGQKTPDIDAEFLDNGKNALPLNAVKMICSTKQPGLAVNQFPLLLCGEAGSGKTHLLNLIYNVLKATEPVRCPLFARSALFLETGPQTRSLWTGDFWNYHSCLILDDIDELTDDYEKQRLLAGALAQTDISAQNSPDRIHRFVFAFNGSARALGQLTTELYLKLQKGLVFQLAPPDITIRLKYLEKHSDMLKLDLKREQLLFLARQSHHLPILKGILNKIVLFKKIYGRLPGEIEMQELLEGQTPYRQLNWRAILEKVCEKLDLSPDKVLENSRKPDITLARQIAMYISRKRLGLSLPEIGRLFGGKDHSTVIHSINKIEKRRLTDKVTHNLLTELEKETF